MGYKLRVGIIRVLSGRWFRGGGCGPWVTLRLPTAKCLASTARHHVLDSKINNPYTTAPKMWSDLLKMMFNL